MTDIEINTNTALKRLAKKKRKEIREVKAKVEAEKESKIDGRKEMPQLWKPGESGNPKGRPVGSKNRLTLLKEAVLNSAENIVLDNFEEIVLATVDLAKKGDPTCLKIIWDRVIPGKRSVEDKDKGSDRLNVMIKIEGMKPAPEEESIEAEFTEIDKDAF